MTSLRKFLSAVLISAVAVGCSSTSKTSTDSGSTTSSSTTTTVASAATTTTAASASTAPATTAKPVTASTTHATNPPATSPATTAAPEIITSFNVSNPSACQAPDISIAPTNPEVTVSWTVVGADSVTVSMDSKGGVWNNGLPLSGSTTVPASCDSNGHNQHTYYVIAIKGGQEIASKKATRGS